MAKRLWGSRFQKEPSKSAQDFTSSLKFDKRLAAYDVKGSIAHIQMLGECGLITKSEAKKICEGLNSILEEIETDRFRYDLGCEDIHSNVQQALEKKIGSIAERLHTARSRNDQVVLDMKLYCKEFISHIFKLVSECQKNILLFADKHKDIIIPGYTHLQPAQCVLLAHHMLAYIEMLERDKGRFKDALGRLDSLPLGSGALSGTSLPIDRHIVAKLLGFSDVTRNSIDSVSDRDFILEFLSACAILSVHYSRIAEDLILWSTREFGFIHIDWQFCTGSSFMPHKKNPDVLELIRGAAGKVFSALNSVLVMMKGLPLAYNRDLQFDKPPLFDAVDLVVDISVILSELFKNILVDRGVISTKIYDEDLFSVDIMEYLIKKGVSYREAHNIVGRLIKEQLDKGRKLSALSTNQLRRYSAKLRPDVKKLLNPVVSVNLKRSYGGTNPQMVKKQMRFWANRLKVRINA